MLGKKDNFEKKRLRDEIYDFVKNDLFPGMFVTARWTSLSNRSLRNMNRRARLGFLWVILSATIFVVAIGLVYALVFNTDRGTLLPYIASGYITWALISSSLLSASSVFPTYRNYITQKNLPLTVYVTSSAFDKIIVFLAQSVVIVTTCCVFKTGLSLALFVLPLSLLLIFINAIGTSFILGVMAVRYRDLGQVVASSILIIFLLTPIIWKPEFAGKRTLIVDVNPFYHFINIVRAPIIDHEIPMMSFVVATGISLLSLVIGSILMATYRHRIIYWL